MGYFSADERLEQSEAAPPAPYNLRLTEIVERNAEVGLAWQRPLGRLEGYLVLVRGHAGRMQYAPTPMAQEVDGAALEWRKVLQVVGREKCGARLKLAADLWGATAVELVVVAYIGEVISPPSNPITLPPRLRPALAVLPPLEEEVQVPPVPIAPPVETENPAPARENPELPELAGWAEIEEALRRNSAALSRHGLFVNRHNPRS
ncbi:MAG: hypothetical protein WCS37_00985 [Chloroflexota bacterium]